jgi:RNA polymerase sigma-70 factor (ECF subfamily)
MRMPGPYQLQAAIAAVHSEAAGPADTDWPQIAALYAELARAFPSPVVELNRAVAVSLAEGPAQGLELVERIEGLDDYHLLHSTRAYLLGRLGRDHEARAAYSRALELASNDVERAFLARRVTSLERRRDA